MSKPKPLESWLSRLESLHRYEMLLYVGMLGSGLVFLFLTVAFLYSDSGEVLAVRGQGMPLGFLLSTFALMLSGYTARQMRRHYQEENIPKLESALRHMLILGVTFTILQHVGWSELSRMGISFRGIPRGSFLYLLSGIHVFHLLGALVFALILLVRLRKTQDDEVQKLLLITNPYEKMRIRLFTVYWHFMDAVWLALFLLFVLSS